MSKPLMVERPDWVWVNTPKKIRKLHSLLERTKLIAIDTETTGLDIYKDQALFCTMSTGDNGYFLEEKDLEHFDDIFQNPNHQWVGSQVKYDFNIMANTGHPIAGDLLCTLTMDRMANPIHGVKHGLKECYAREFNEHMPDIGEMFYPRNKWGVPVKPKDKTKPEVLYEAWERGEHDKVINYATLDAYGVLRLFRELRRQLKEVVTYWGPTQYDLFLRWEVPMTRALYEMEREGIQVDVEYLKDLGPQIEARASEILTAVQKKYKQVINLRSGPQVSDLLYNQLGLTPLKMTSGGASGIKKPSVAEGVLLQHANDGVEVAKDIIEYRSLLKTKADYGDKLQGLVDRNNRVHATFNQAEAVTARLSVSKPPLQQIPRPDSDKFKLRKAFIARPGYVLIGADYDQIEMVVAAHNSADPTMCSAIREGRDIHSANVATVWGVNYDRVIAAKKKGDAKEDLSDDEFDLIIKRTEVKSVGFGQFEAEVKPLSQRGNLSAAA